MLRPIKLRYYVTYMVEHGYSASAVLAETGISSEQLFDTALLIDPYQYEVVIRNMLRITKDPALGFKVGANVQLNDVGIVAYAMMSSQTLREAAMLWFQYQNLVGMTVKMSIKETKTSWTTFFEPSGMREQTVRFYTEETLSSFLTLGEALTGKHYMPHAVSIALPPPPHADLYAEVLRSPVRFNAPHTSLTMKTVRSLLACAVSFSGNRCSPLRWKCPLNILA
jgi:hypothetical protein